MGEETGRTYACQLEDFGSQVLENRGYVHGSLGTDAHLVLGVLLEETLDTAAGKLARRSWSAWRHVARKDGRDESRRESGFRGLRASSSASPPAGHATSVERRSQGQVAGRRRRVVDASRRDSRCSCHRSLLGGVERSLTRRMCPSRAAPHRGEAGRRGSRRPNARTPPESSSSLVVHRRGKGVILPADRREQSGSAASCGPRRSSCRPSSCHQKTFPCRRAFWMRVFRSLGSGEASSKNRRFKRRRVDSSSKMRAMVMQVGCVRTVVELWGGGEEVVWQKFSWGGWIQCCCCLPCCSSPGGRVAWSGSKGVQQQRARGRRNAD